MHEPNDLATEVQELAWALVDEQATENQVHRLEELLLADREARRVYVTCMQMHADLHYLLSGKRPSLPAAVEEAVKAAAAKKRARRVVPLPTVEMPAISGTISLIEAFGPP